MEKPLGGTWEWRVSPCSGAGPGTEGLRGAGKAYNPGWASWGGGSCSLGLLEVVALGWAVGCCLGGFWLQQCRVTAPEKGSLLPEGLFWGWHRVGSLMGILHLWFGGCCGKLGSGTLKPKNMEFRELGGLCQLLCGCSGKGYPCEMGEYKDLLESLMSLYHNILLRPNTSLLSYECGETEAWSGEGVCPRSDTEQVSKRTQADKVCCCHPQTKLPLLGG